MTKQHSEVEVEGPGFRRMKARLGPAKMEAMRLRVLAEQAEALAGVRGKPPAQPQDRAGYEGYPPGRPRKREK